MAAKNFGNIVLLLATVLITYTVLNLVVLLTGIAGGVSLTALVLDEVRINLLPAIILNKEGFRRPSPVVPKGNLFRILVLGDSFTFGLGVEAEESYPEVLERMLNEHSESIEFEVLNLGMSGASTDDEYILLRYLVRYLEYTPDIVVLQTLHNDVYFCSEFPIGEFLSGKRDTRKNALQSELELDASAQEIFQQPSLLPVFPDTFPEEEYELERYALSLPHVERCACSKKYFDLIYETTTSAGADLLVYDIELGSQLGCFTEGSSYSYMQRNRNLNSRRYWLSRADPHPNKEGHRKMAEELVPMIKCIIRGDVRC